MLKYVVVAVMLTAFATPALAEEWYVVQDPTTKKCSQTKKKPDGQSLVMVGTGTYTTNDEAKAARKAAPECAKPEAN
jgi:hypothetical protein